MAKEIERPTDRQTVPATIALDALLAGSIVLPLRLVVGWTYFSAFWRRLILDNKLLPDDPGYIGEKFNHFLPNALWIGPILEYLLSEPSLLWWNLMFFTVIEGIVGVCLMAGLLTRMMGLLTSFLALGILLGAGWLGTTCVDEWQIGILGIASGLVCTFAGGGRYSIDYLLWQRWGIGRNNPVAWGRRLDTPSLLQSKAALPLATIAAFGLTLLTNQVFHGGVFGKLHNMSVNPVVKLSNARIEDGALVFEAYRVEGVDVYGSFAIGLTVYDQAGRSVAGWSAADLAGLPQDRIANRFVAKVAPGKHSLIIPLGAKAELRLSNIRLNNLPNGDYSVELVDISGSRWNTPLSIRRRS